MVSFPDIRAAYRARVALSDPVSHFQDWAKTQAYPCTIPPAAAQHPLSMLSQEQVIHRGFFFNESVELLPELTISLLCFFFFYFFLSAKDIYAKHAQHMEVIVTVKKQWSTNYLNILWQEFQSSPPHFIACLF